MKKIIIKNNDKNKIHYKNQDSGKFSLIMKDKFLFKSIFLNNKNTSMQELKETNIILEELNIKESTMTKSINQRIKDILQEIIYK